MQIAILPRHSGNLRIGEAIGQLPDRFFEGEPDAGADVRWRRRRKTVPLEGRGHALRDATRRIDDGPVEVKNDQIEHVHVPAGTGKPAGPSWQRGHVVRDYHRHGLRRPAYGQQWVKVDNDFLLISIASGLIGGIIASQY